MRSQLSQLDEGEYLNLLGLESRLLDCLAAERSFGAAERSRVEKARVVKELNALALRTIDIPFNDLCSPQVSLPRKGLVSHNLPHQDYGRFIGREQEVSDLLEELQPHPEGQWPVIIVHGIGGSGKTTLTLEVAWRLVRGHESIEPEERFDAIVWVTAKESVLTTAGIKPRVPHFRSISDIFDAIALTLERPDIIEIDSEDKEATVRQMLGDQRILLIVDNLETVDDPQIETFLREPPYPTKVMITSRHKLEGLPGLPFRLSGMTRDECFDLIERECLREKHNEVVLTHAQAERLFECTGGVPLAVVWSVGLVRGGRDIELVMKRLRSAGSDIARFCFDYSVDIVREDGAAHKLLMALSLFPAETSRTTLGIVTGLDQDEDTLIEALGRLERLSMTRHRGDRYSMLPLARTYALAEMEQYPDFQQSILSRWKLERDIEVRHIDKLWCNAVDALMDEAYPDFESICHELARSLATLWGTSIVHDTALQGAHVLGFVVETNFGFSDISLPSEMPLLFLKAARLTNKAL